MKRLNGKIEGELDVKRFYFTGEIKCKCPNCQAKMTHDFSSDYLSFPIPGEELDLYFYCQECDSEWYMDAQLKSIDVKIDYDADSLRPAS